MSRELIIERLIAFRRVTVGDVAEGEWMLDDVVAELRGVRFQTIVPRNSDGVARAVKRVREEKALTPMGLARLEGCTYMAASGRLNEAAALGLLRKHVGDDHSVHFTVAEVTS
jgi:hypothetical protein